MSGDITPYTGHITSEHADKPNFMAWVAALTQPFADITALINSIVAAFDLDDAIGAQLDVVGLWVGRSRNIAVPDDIYFSFDQNGVGFDQGIWFQEYDPTTNQFALPDDHYRLLLRAKIAANQWNGSVPGAYAAWEILLAPYGMTVLIQDNQDMTMTIGITGQFPDPLTKALVTGGYLTLVPCGVGVTGYLEPSVEGAPFFGFDVENSAISGFDNGAWGTPI